MFIARRYEKVMSQQDQQHSTGHTLEAHQGVLLQGVARCVQWLPVQHPLYLTASTLRLGSKHKLTVNCFAATGFGGDITSKGILDFVDSGKHLVIAGSSDASDMIRR